MPMLGVWQAQALQQLGIPHHTRRQPRCPVGLTAQSLGPQSPHLRHNPPHCQQAPQQQQQWPLHALQLRHHTQQPELQALQLRQHQVLLQQHGALQGLHLWHQALHMLELLQHKVLAHLRHQAQLLQFLQLRHEAPLQPIQLVHKAPRQDNGTSQPHGALQLRDKATQQHGPRRQMQMA
jgi:hypothetical protein